VFRKMIRDMAAENGLPDYTLAFTEGDIVRVRARRGLDGGAGEGPRLDPEVFERARAVAPGYDPYWLEDD
jgi:hypothetical protein